MRLYKRFGRVEALRGVSLEVPRGRVVGLLGLMVWVSLRC